MINPVFEANDYVYELEELLRRIDANTALCPICGSVTAEIIKGKHADDCKLARVLKRNEE